MQGKNYETNQSVANPYNATLFVSQCAEISDAVKNSQETGFDDGLTIIISVLQLIPETMT